MDGTEATITRCGTCRKCGVTVRSRGSRGRTPSICVACKRQDHRDAARCKVYALKCQKCCQEFSSVGSPQRKFCGQCPGGYLKAEKACCRYCGCEFDRWRQGGNSSGLFCSKGCCGEHRSRLKSARRAVALLQRAYKKRKRAARKAADRAEALSRKRPCLNCGTLFLSGRDRLCSVECRKQARRRNKKAGRKARVAHGHHERCKIGGLPFDPSVTRDFVFSRDGFVCMLCGAKTVNGDRSLAPTIGHIVPLKNPLNAKHGHTPENTCTNCAMCNGRQGNAVLIDGHQNHDDPRASLLEAIKSTGYPLRRGCRDAEDPTAPRRGFLTAYFQTETTHGPPRTTS